MLEPLEQRYARLKSADAIYQQGVVVTADTGFANEANMQYLHDRKINGYIPITVFVAVIRVLLCKKTSTENAISLPIGTTARL